MRLIFAMLLCAASCSAQLQVGGAVAGGGNSLTSNDTVAPAIYNVVATPTDTTVVFQWSTTAASSSAAACGASPGTYTVNDVDGGMETFVTVHEVVVANLPAGGQTYCKVTSTNSHGTASSTVPVLTLPGSPSTPITGLIFSTPTTYNSINSANQGSADTFYNAVAKNGFTYFTNDDTVGPGGAPGGYSESGVPSPTSSASSIVEFTSDSPLAAQTINPLANYGPCCTVSGDDGFSQKQSGLFAMDGYLFMTLGRQDQTGTTPDYAQFSGQISKSADYGLTWSNFQAPTVFVAGGAITTPASASMFGTGGPTTMGSATFVMQCGDDGTRGYLDPCNAHDNANAFVYLIANEGAWNGGGSTGGNALYLARVPRARIGNLSAADYTWATGSSCNAAANWSSSMSAAVPIITNTGKMGEPNVQYVPALNRYLLLTFYYPSGRTVTNNTVWLGYEAPSSCGPWTLINTTAWTSSSTVPGAYNPIIRNKTIWTGNTPQIMFTGDFGTAGLTGSAFLYQMYLSTMTIQHP